MECREAEVKVTVCVSRLAASLYASLSGRRISVSELALAMGISNVAAGRILAKMESLGFARRLSRGRYRILPSAVLSSFDDGRGAIGCNGDPEY